MSSSSAAKESTQEEVFHTFNALVDQNRQIVISADKSPSGLEGLEERMRSQARLGARSPTLHPDHLGAAFRHPRIEGRAERHNDSPEGDGVPSPQDHLERPGTRRCLKSIIADMHVIGREVTLENAQELLRDLLRVL